VRFCKRHAFGASKLKRYLTSNPISRAGAMTKTETLIDNETIVLAGEEFGFDGESAVLQWSVHRTVSNRPPRVVVVSDSSDASKIGFDLRFDLYSDPTSLELTRGVVIELTSYSALGGTNPQLRAAATKELHRRIVDLSFQLPPDDLVK